MRTFYLKDDIYQHQILVILDCNYETMEKHLVKLFGRPVDLPERIVSIEGCMFYLQDTETKQRNYILWFGEAKTRSWNIAGMAHEILHASLSITRIIGIKHSEDTDEALCYYFTYLFEQLLNKLCQKKKR